MASMSVCKVNSTLMTGTVSVDAMIAIERVNSVEELKVVLGRLLLELEVKLLIFGDVLKERKKN